MNTIDMTAHDAERTYGQGMEMFPPRAPATRETFDAFDAAAHLGRRRDELQHQLGELLAERSAPATWSNHLVEDAGDHQHRHSNAVVAAILLDELRQVERALLRIVTGEYAVCEECGDPIPPRRLQALPATTLCLSCQARREARDV